MAGMGVLESVNNYLISTWYQSRRYNTITAYVLLYIKPGLGVLHVLGEGCSPAGEGCVGLYSVGFDSSLSREDIISATSFWLGQDVVRQIHRFTENQTCTSL